ncbi:MFS transporter [Agromyces italicus]|uniref:MFS transporter n=1 Tax=Agromyces italicus TaxID=279572 RepID=UPI000428572E|nr:MFS transporter [Agromyces italicus]
MDWRGIFGVLTGIGVLLFVLAATLLRETLPPARRHGGGVLRTTGRHLGELGQDRVFVTLLIASAAGGVAFFTYLSQSSFVLQNEYGLSPQLFSLVFAANALANMIGAQASRLGVRRLGPVRMYLGGQTATAFAALLFAGVALAGLPVAAVVGALALYLFSTGIGGPNGTTIALGAHAERAGTASAALGTLQFTIGPIVAPLAAVGGSNAISMSGTMAVASCVAAALAWLVVRPLAVRAAAGPADGTPSRADER